MNCQICGKEIKEYYIFCPNCGSLISRSTNVNQYPVSQFTEYPKLSNTEILQKINSSSSRQSFTIKFLILLIISSVIFLVSLACFSFMSISGYLSSGILGLITGTIAVILSLIYSTIFLVIIRQVDIYEKEPWSIVIFSFVWGALGATLFSLFFNEINSAIFTYIFGPQLGKTLTAVISAPIFEEFFKLMIIPIIIIFFRANFNSPLDGIVYIFSSSLGFKIVEDLVYGAMFTRSAGAVEGFFLLVIGRWLMGFMGHPLMSVFSGFAVGLATINNNFIIKFILIISGYLLSVFAHFVWNFMASVGASTSYYLVCLWFPIQISILIVIFFILYFISLNIEKNILRETLQEDVATGLLNNQIIDELLDFKLRRMRKNSLPSEIGKLYDIFLQELASYALLKKQSTNSIGQEILNTMNEKKQIISLLKPYIYGGVE